MEFKRYSILDIKAANYNGGYYFFQPSTMRFFRSRVLERVYNGIGGHYFVTSERYSGCDRYYTVRSFNPKSGSIDTVGGFNELTKYKAQKSAEYFAVHGEPQKCEDCQKSL